MPRLHACGTGGQAASGTRDCKPKYSPGSFTSIRDKMLLAALTMAAALVGCQDEDIRAYHAPKPPPVPIPAAAPSPAQRLNTPHSAHTAGPQITWDAPSHWQSQPAAGMRFATFVIGPTEQQAQLSILHLPDVPQVTALVPNINRPGGWADQVGHPAVTEDQLSQLQTQFEVEGVPVTLVDLASPPSVDDPRRLLVAFMNHGDRVWFFKLIGPKPVVDAEQAAFDKFVRSVRFVDRPDPTPTATPAPPGPMARPGPLAPPAPPADPTGTLSPPRSQLITYDVPDVWDPIPESDMRRRTADTVYRAAFVVTQDDATARMTISAFSRELGTALDNVNRWRRQVGLGPISAMNDQPVVQVNAANVSGLMLDLLGPADQTGQASQMLVALFADRGRTWFFKLMGPADLVANQRGRFGDLVRSVRFAEPAGE